jgi:hypothetical protein
MYERNEKLIKIVINTLAPDNLGKEYQGIRVYKRIVIGLSLVLSDKQTPKQYNVEGAFINKFITLNLYYTLHLCVEADKCVIPSILFLLTAYEKEIIVTVGHVLP